MKKIKKQQRRIKKKRQGDKQIYEGQAFATGYWLPYGRQTIQVLFLYEEQFEAVNAKLNPENNKEIKFRIATAFYEATRIQLKIYSEKTAPYHEPFAVLSCMYYGNTPTPYYPNWDTETFEDLSRIQQEAWKEVGNAFIIQVKEFKEFDEAMAQKERKEAVLH